MYICIYLLCIIFLYIYIYNILINISKCEQENNNKKVDIISSKCRRLFQLLLGCILGLRVPSLDLRIQEILFKGNIDRAHLKGI